MATRQSQSDQLLVVREVSAPLPNLEETNPAASGGSNRVRRNGLHENVTVISQFPDEQESVFAERVMARVARELGQGATFRAVVVAAGYELEESVAQARRGLIHSLAAMLALRPNGALVIRAPAHASEATRAHLFDLMESTARGAPHLHVQVAFPEVKLQNRAKMTAKITNLRLSV